ncbi:MAG: hypothetical protein M9947_15760 [Thermomicrobiales bacterium]|nr:hypothetical protein [Thermomicrobiales bacterium]
MPGTVITLDAAWGANGRSPRPSSQGGAYVLALKKGNQNQLHADVQDFFVDGLATGFAAPIDQAETVEKGHGRIEKRVCWASEDANLLRAILDPGA